MVEIIIALVTLVALEIILGIDNVIFISILSSKLPKEMQKRARQIGLFLAMFMRLGLLTVITWIMKLKNDLFVILDNGISSKEFNRLSFNAVIVQIMIMDLVFSLDSIITAVGLAEHLWVMCTAVIISVGIMMWAATPVADFVDRHPAFKILALSFLLLIGFALVAEGFDVHIPKGYIYFSMGFAFLVNLIQMRTGKKTKTKPVELHEHYTEDEEDLPKDIF
ncbi:MAG: TerC family protein [Saprospiraceae bacterium]|nr:TerC family protein [Candidatus Vicinibacter affinis]